MKTSLALLSSLLLFVGCSTAPSSPQEARNLHNAARDTIEEYERVDPYMKNFLNRAYGYAIFPGVGKGGFIVGGAYGNGEVYEKGVLVGYCDVSQGTVGAQIGGQSYSELLVFENKAALDRFKRNEFQFAAQASAVVMKSGAS